MKISLVTPAGKHSRAGNRRTATRWARILRELGHRVEIAEMDHGDRADMMVAVHAWRSLESIRAFSDRYPDRPLVVLLAGTDIYRFQFSHPEETHEAMARADRLICLHELVHRVVPDRFRPKLHVIFQSAEPLPSIRQPSPRWFEVCVVGHLRDEKDSLRAAFAARLVPPESRLRVVQLGKAQDDAWAGAARVEASSNLRYVWRGEVPGGTVRRQFARSHAMVISSVMEGGANVVSEAVVSDLPVIASHIDGNVGLLGPDYDGYFPAKDEKALAQVLRRAECEPAYLPHLLDQCRERRDLFRPEFEKAAWARLLGGLTE